MFTTVLLFFLFRFLVLIEGEGAVYALDRAHRVFKFNRLTFPVRRGLRHFEDTLIDTWLVLCNGGDEEKDVIWEGEEGSLQLLVFDVVYLEVRLSPSIVRCCTPSPFTFKDKNIGAHHFAVRTEAIEKELVAPRDQAIKRGEIVPAEESVAVRHMPFFPLDDAGQLMSPQFQQFVGHSVDGLIFQPNDEVCCSLYHCLAVHIISYHLFQPYKPGTNRRVLKWKPREKCTIDFLLRVEERELEGGTTSLVAGLYTQRGIESSFSYIHPVDERLRALDGRIVECAYSVSPFCCCRLRIAYSSPHCLSDLRPSVEVGEGEDRQAASELAGDRHLYLAHHPSSDLTRRARAVHRQQKEGEGEGTG